MYEFELEHGEFPYALKPDEIALFSDKDAHITHRTVLDWGEHCTECAAPECYQTCDFYDRRSDGKCRRFDNGVTETVSPSSLTGYLIGIRFKRWGKIWSPGNLALYPLDKAEKYENRMRGIGNKIRSLPFRNTTITGRSPSSVFRNRRRKWVESAEPCGPPASYLLVEVLNPANEPVKLQIEIQPESSAHGRPVIKDYLIEDFLRIKIPVSEIVQRIDMNQPFHIDIIPAATDHPVDLVFGTTELVHDVAWEKATSGAIKDSEETSTAKTKKMVVWDLDNTLWQGILVEDGLNALRLNNAAVDAIRELDRRGILHGIASKNNEEEALQALRHFGLDEYFLYPQINWGPKNQSIRRIAKLMNIGLDSLVFIDDSEFEREEVSTAVPEVLCLPDSKIEELLSRSEFDVPVTGDSARRREFYRGQQQREVAEESFDDDYLHFLEDCQITLQILELDESSAQRAYELAQRTNQMNFSGNRYAMEEISALMADSSVECIILKCQDRFGDYGIIGFCIYEPGKALIRDLMFSCRIQSRHVDVSFLNWLSQRAAANGHERLQANYRPSKKNKPASRVFDELNFQTLDDTGEVHLLARDLNDLPAKDQIINVQAAL